MSDRPIPNALSIELYLHCGKCLEQEAHPQQLEVGWTRLGLQVWCKRHQLNVIHIDFDDQKMRANQTADMGAAAP
jgi:hypothetical protein